MPRLDGCIPRMDQAWRLRQLMTRGGTAPVRAPRSAHLIAVASGKGGVGKTMVSVNLAIALAARGHRVILFDMDLGLANADIMLGVEVRATWSDVISGRRSLEEVIVQAPGEIAFVPGASGVARVANLSDFERHQLCQALQQAEDCYDVVIFDCGAGISRNVISVAGEADSIVVVATPEPTSITDAYALIKVLAQDQEAGIYSGDRMGSLGLVINLAENRREGRDTFERLAGVAARFLHLAVTEYGFIVRDDHVPQAVRQRCPVLLRYPRCAASTCLMASAARLSNELGQPQPGESLFYRVMNMFV